MSNKREPFGNTLSMPFNKCLLEECDHRSFVGTRELRIANSTSQELPWASGKGMREKMACSSEKLAI
jgi:hypothetical protein